MAQDFKTEENQRMLKLTREERAWLNDYRKAIEGKHPGVVHEMLIYGSKARGQAHAESDLDVLLVITNEAGSLKKKATAYRLLAGRDLERSSIHPCVHAGRVGKPEKEPVHLPSGGRT
jgi:predicted nucleotidyltransferase